jgi:hypothetical protein
MAGLPWIPYQSRAGFTLEHPPGWSVQQPESPTAVAFANADSSQMVLVEHLPPGTAGPCAEILRQRRFSASVLYEGITPQIIEEGPGAASYVTNFKLTDGRKMRGRVRCKVTEGGFTVLAAAALEEVYPHVEALLDRVLRSYQRVTAQAPAPVVAPAAPDLAYVSFTDPVAGAFTVDVPKGWRVRGGLHRPGLGDRRVWVELVSPQGIVILNGDPNCPQCFCHYPMTPQDVMVPTAQGCTFLNISPSAKKLHDYYLKHVAAKGLGTMKVVSQRERPDLAAQEIQLVRAQGIPVAKSMKVSILETRFAAPGRAGCCYAGCWHDPSTSLGFMTVWTGGILVWLTPVGLEAVAEQVVQRMRTSFRVTQKLYEIVQQDEMAITSNGMAANMNQQMWFQGQQAVHNAQMAQGDAIVHNYWQQQHANDAISQSYWNAQHTYDKASDNWSDAMLDKQRLYDDSLGKTYETPGGHNYYWRDQQTDQVIGTDTSDPPDYLRNYTPLKKL